MSLDYTKVSNFDLESLAPGKVTRLGLEIMESPLGVITYLPLMVAKGVHPGPVVGFTAAVHGNELNGIRVIHKLFKELDSDVSQLSGIIIGVPIVNIPGYMRNQREFNDGFDLNRIMPGKADGNSSEQFAYKFINTVIAKMDYLIDLHTASFGRVNSLYVRANMEDDEVAKMAYLQDPQIIVNNKGEDNSLRGAASRMGVKSITVEVGDPQKFQRKLIKFSLVGIHNILSSLNMLPLDEEGSEYDPVICGRSYWMYTDRGGMLEVYPDVCESVKKGQKVAQLTNAFGDLLKEYFSPEDGVVVGRSTNPVSQTGGRILHLGVPK